MPRACASQRSRRHHHVAGRPLSRLQPRRRSRIGFGTALVTGASSGIGEAMVRRLVHDGARVVAVARRRDRLEDLAGELAREPGSVEILAVDLATDDGLAAAVARVGDAGRPLDLVVNNAGFGTYGSLADLSADRLANEIDLNVGALTALSHAAVRSMLPTGRGHLINVASIAAFLPTPQLAVYGATKAYVLSFTQALHEEVRSQGVQVTTLCPGWTRTEFQQVSGSARRVTSIPGWAWMSADDVARAALRGAARGRAVVTPGALYKAIAVATNIAPRSLARRVAARVQRQGH